MKTLINCGLLFALLVLWAACSHKETPAPAPTNTNDTSGNNTNNGNNNNGNNGSVPDTGICFERDILPIFVSNCAKSGTAIGTRKQIRARTIASVPSITASPRRPAPA